MRLILVRHGQTPSNVSGALDTGEPGAGLTDLGHRQAAAVPPALAEHRIAGLYASPLVRTQLTAAPLAERTGLAVVVRRGLQEVSAGDVEMRHDDDAVAAYLGTLRAWIHGDLAYQLPGGEDGTGFVARFSGALREIESAHGPDDTVVVVSHGAAIRVWTTLATSLPPEQAADRRIANTAAAFLDGSAEGGWTLTRWTDEPLGGAALLDEAAHDVTGDEEHDQVEDQGE